MLRSFGLLIPIALVACGSSSDSSSGPPPFAIAEAATFIEPWAMTFLPDGRALVTEKRGSIKLWDGDGLIVDVTGGPKPVYGGQGGLGDIILHPDFANNGLVYLSWVEGGGKASGAAVGRAKLTISEEFVDMPEIGGSENLTIARLEGLQVIWRQEPKVSGNGHFGHRLAFGPDGMLYISSGERQKFDPAQNPDMNLGKIVRLTDAGMIPSDNPWYDQGRLRAQIWSLGHRNPLGIAFDGAGRLWEIEMGPRGGDEVNLVVRGANYGWPRASNGTHYDGRDIPDHRAGDGYQAPKVWWNPSISPGSLMIYSGKAFPQWQGDAFIGALGGEALIRIDLDGERAVKADHWAMDSRIREVEQGPDGAIWLLEDSEDGETARLLKLTPK